MAKFYDTFLLMEKNDFSRVISPSKLKGFFIEDLPFLHAFL